MPVTKMSILEGVHYIATYLQHFLQDTPISSHFFFRYPNPIVISELTEQDGRKKRAAKLPCVTNMTGLLFACFVVIIT